MIPKADLLLIIKRGLIPGPKETEDLFLKRARATLDYIPSQDADSLVTKLQWQEALSRVSSIFGIAPDWATGFYSNKSLRPWQGAVAWISDDTPPLIQLRVGFRKGRYLRIYKREEVLAHEAVHASRTAFEEPYFEEMFAYKVSSSLFQRAFGALFIRSWEAPLLLLLLLGGLWEELVFLPFAGFAFLSIRLLVLHLAFQMCHKKLKTIIKDPTLTSTALLHLSDKEIFLFARSRLLKIQEYMKKQKSFRWQVFMLAYLSR